MLTKARLPAIAIGNGRLLVTTDADGEVLSCCWPNIDSPNNIAVLSVHPIPASAQPTSPTEPARYVDNTNVAHGRSESGITYKDVVADAAGSASLETDVYARKITGPHPDLGIYVVPETDGRPGAQTIYWDEKSEVLLAFCRHVWMAIGCGRGHVTDFHCGRQGSDSSAIHLKNNSSLPGERIAFRQVDGALRVRGSEEDTFIYTVFGSTREDVLSAVEAQRAASWTSIETASRDHAAKVLTESTLRGWSNKIDSVLHRSCLVWDVLTNRTTGGMVAGPDVKSGIESAPGYAANWGRDAAWTLLGALATGQVSLCRRMIEFAFATQSPEGLWLHRHHTDHAIASSWGLHQIDETGILLFAIEAYVSKTGDKSVLQGRWDAVCRAAEFLVASRDEKRGLPLPSVDLWEEREGYHLYTAASSIAGLRAAVQLAKTLGIEVSCSAEWAEVADSMLRRTEDTFWDGERNRFICSLENSAALPMVDSERPELSATVQTVGTRPTTAIPQYPNWRDEHVDSISYGHDISTLALAIPFGILRPDDPRVAATADSIYKTLWNQRVGGLSRYEGDSYGGGNPWPLVTLWLAMYEAGRGRGDKARQMVDWVESHMTPAGLVPEQVHRTEGTPVAAVPLSWSHGMIALAVAAIIDNSS
ncbi:hypothetical protein CDV36_014353 [Fusarium kuroshium]|uniref:GH15-like domain-containing protein n=1 Tax=Fusarium kuroshium TaxID=2010991 RepID=A0A3M2RI49_9HYPO|nr:hypothetical protein CDV36_014353 [Fusarium kuroshium]